MENSSKRTIVDAIAAVLKDAKKSMSAEEIYNSIVSSKLYKFRADNPIHVVSTQIRRHCLELDFPSSAKTKYFGIENGKYFLLDKSVDKVIENKKNAKQVSSKINSITSLNELKRIHNQYLIELKERILKDIKKLTPTLFEKFCRNLLTAYGFQETTVTKAGRDGGIDGYGKLKVGVSFLSVAFQCKRYNSKTIGRPEINQFRGDIQGQYELGYFFSTSNYSSDAENNAFKSGAAPIILINGGSIVDIMLEKWLGIEENHLAIYDFNLDLALTDPEE